MKLNASHRLKATLDKGVLDAISKKLMGDKIITSPIKSWDSSRKGFMVGAAKLADKDLGFFNQVLKSAVVQVTAYTDPGQPDMVGLDLDLLWVTKKGGENGINLGFYVYSVGSGRLEKDN